MHKSELHNVLTFSSPAEFGEYCISKNMYHRGDSAGEWTNCLSGRDAARLAIVGDDSVVAAAQQLMEKFQSSIETSSFMDMPSVAGCYPCVPEALAGEPECMREPMEISSDTAPLTIVVDLACSGGISASIMQKRGVAILALVMALSVTRPISLKMLSCGDGTRNHVGDKYSICAVDFPTTPLDLATAAYGLSNVGFVRQLFYGVQGKKLGFTGKWGQFAGCGPYDCENPLYGQSVLKYMEIDGEVLYITGAVSESALIMKDPEAWLLEQLKKYQHHE